jgi:hypothetical protein
MHKSVLQYQVKFRRYSHQRTYILTIQLLQLLLRSDRMLKEVTHKF